MNERIMMYLAELGIGENSKTNYLRYISYIADWLQQAGIDLGDLTPTTFKRFLKSKNWSNASEYHCLTALRGYLRWKYGDDHPLLAMSFKRERPAPQRVLKPNEIMIVIESFDDFTPGGIRNLAMFLLLLDTGLRASEVCRLSLEHLDIENQTLQCKRKGGVWKASVFSLETAELLQAWLKVREKFALPGVDAVFVSVGGIKRGQPITPDGLRSIFRAIAQKARVKHFSPHSLRRTFATESLKNGAPSRLVQVAGCWSDLAMVERYSQSIQPSDFREYFVGAKFMNGRKRTGQVTAQPVQRGAP